MKHTYKVSGMTCNKCVQTVKDALEKIPGIENINVNLAENSAEITMNAHVPVSVMNAELGKHGNYRLEENAGTHKAADNFSGSDSAVNSSFFSKYKPIILLFAYLTGTTLLSELFKEEFVLMRWMHMFMGGFFLTFSFFKFLDLKGFAYSYSSYDVVAKKWVGWGFIYPFVELGLGLAFLFHYQIFAVTITTLIVMGVSSIGVIQSLAAKRKFQCACLGTVFNLPMSYITLTEDLLMVLMSIYMLIV